MKISHLNKIHFSLDLLKERSAEYPGNIITSLILSQNNALFGKKKKSPWGLGLASSTILFANGCQYNAGPGSGSIFFFF